MNETLGFGLMRLPLRGDSEIDPAECCRLTDAFLQKGFCWFDTAKPYHAEQSEQAFRKAVAERHPRSAYKIADKLSISYVHSAGDPERIFREQLKTTGVEYFDRYLLHAMDAGKMEEARKFRFHEFLLSLKQRGLAREIGFSFHDTADVLEKMLQEYPEADFVQLQINYADWESPSVQSRKCAEVARKHGKYIVVMEPVKGGMLGPGMNETLSSILKTADPARSIASWAVRFAASVPGVRTVLSGMSNMEQVLDNASFMEHFTPLSETERAAIARVTEEMKKISLVPCTRCGYCSKCPAEIPIPNLLSVLNNRRMFGMTPGVLSSYRWYARKKTPADCLQCGACEKVCPQHLKIREFLRELGQNFAS